MNENIAEEIEIIKNQVSFGDEISSEVKGMTESFNSRIDQEEQRISDLEDKASETIQSDKNKKKRI